MASSVAAEEAGNDAYRDDHMAQIFSEGFSFSGFERDYLGLRVPPVARTPGDASGTTAADTSGAATGDASGGAGFGDAGGYLDISGISGADSISDGRGAAFADFDNDGDTDIFLVALQGDAHHLFRNNVGSDNHFLRVELIGTTSGRDAYGAVVRVKTSAGTLTKVKAGGSGYLAQHDPRLLFGLGGDEGVEWIEVTWPTGAVQREAVIAADSTIRIVEDGAFTSVSEPRFELVEPLEPEEALFAKLTFDAGDPFPDLPLESGSVYDLISPGRRTLVNLWATWCIPCRTEMPELEALSGPLAEVGIDLVGVSVDLETRDRVSEFVASVGATYPIRIVADESFVDIWRNNEVFVPMSVLLDDRGRVLQVFEGWSARTAAALRGLVEAGRPPE